MSLLRIASFPLLLALAACADRSSEPVATPLAAEPATDTPTTADAPPTAPVPDAAAQNSDFDPASVPESTATLPPFPFFKEPDGLTSLLDDKQRNKSFDREHMIAGDKVVAVEGKVFRDNFLLANPDREYSGIEFQRNYADAVKALGGMEVSRVQHTNPVNDAFGGREAVDKHYNGICASDGCENHTYLIRQGGKEYWIQVSSGAIPLHGAVVVLERQGMVSKLAFLDAAAMKQKLDADGRIALYINFDLDKAELRSDAQPVIDEIVKLLQADPVLRISIDGHTDSTGDAAHNRDLSQRRAKSVLAALAARGITQDRLQSQGFGPDKPIASNADEAGRAKNRRVELVKQ